MKKTVSVIALAILFSLNFGCKTASKSSDNTLSIIEKMPDDYGIDWLEQKNPKAAKAFRKQMADRKISTSVGPLVKVIEALAREGKAVEALAVIEKQFSKEISLIGKISKTNYAGLSQLDDQVEYAIIRKLSEETSLAKLFNTKGTTLYKLREAAKGNTTDVAGASELLTSVSKNKATNLSKFIEELKKSPEFANNPESLNKMISKSIEVFNETKERGFPRSFIVEDTCANIVSPTQAERITEMMDDYLKTIRTTDRVCALTEAWALFKFQNKLGYEGLVALERVSQLEACEFAPSPISKAARKLAGLSADARAALATTPPSCN